jgi:hypothetical protein
LTSATHEPAKTTWALNRVLPPCRVNLIPLTPYHKPRKKRKPLDALPRLDEVPGNQLLQANTGFAGKAYGDLRDWCSQ